MDNNLLKEKSNNEVNSSSIEMTNLSEQSQKSFVPKIRIRLRPQLVRSSNLCCEELNSNDIGASTKDICDKILLVQPNSDIISWNSNKRCYKALEDSGGGGDYELHDYKNHFMNHGINLRSRPQKLTNQCKNTVVNEKKKLNLITQPKNKDFIKKSKLTKKGVYQSLILKTSKCIDDPNKSVSNNKLSRKQINKNRSETLVSNINLKDIINHENFIKFPSEIQWQLVNLLPNCDKPKLSSELDSCKCTDSIYNSNDNCQTFPNLGFSVLNNEFLGKALAKFSLKMGQCDLINILNSERENLRSRPLAILNDEAILKSNVENTVELNECQDVNTSNEENHKISDEVKSNSSTTTTDTVEMNGIGNVDEKSFIQCQDNFRSVLHESQNDLNLEKDLINAVREEKENSSLDLEKPLALSILSQLPIKEESMVNENSQELINTTISTKIDEKHSSSILMHNISFESSDNRSTNSELTEEKRRRRGRKRKLFSSSGDLQITPIKRSNRSTAGKRPARLDSESPPISPNAFATSDKKFNVKCKKYKDQIHSNKKHKIKYETFSDKFDNIKLELKASKQSENSLDSSKNLKICPPSPDSLFSGQTESDLSPLSKPSPNGGSLYNNCIRSNLISNHINSVQTLSPSWSCTSESTTPSAKSDYGHIQPTKPTPNASISVAENNNSKTIIDAEVKQLQRMPPPRQTLTLAAMREKMRAKKLAKEDNRKLSNSSTRKSSSVLNNQKYKKQNLNVLLKEGDDDFKLMEKIINSSEDIDDLLNNSQESLLDFFMGNNYDFDSVSEQGVSLNSFNYKSNLSKKCSLKTSTNVKDKASKISIPISNNSENNYDEKNLQTSKIILNECKIPYDKALSSSSENNQINKDLPNNEKSFTDAISYVLQKLNLSKDNNGIVSHNVPGKSSHPNAYLVDSNGLTNALSIIQSLNPGAKVTTQQFYLVNSGPQLVLQPNPPLTVGAEKVTSPVGFQNKVSLAPKLTNPISTINQTTNIIRDHIPSHNTSLSGVSISQISYNPIISDRSIIQIPETSIDSRLSLKMSVTEAKNTFMVSSITPNLPCNQSRSLHLQTISTPQPIGFVQPVQQSLPSLFPSQLRFMPQTLSNSATSNTISFLTSNNATCNASIVNTNQQPKLLFLCPTVQNNSNLVTASNVLNQEQKYLLLSKQPDKQATIQLVSSQGLWQQLNPNIISQPNNVLVMQSQPINTVYESLLCQNTYLPAVSPINTDYSINERKGHLTNEISQISTIFKEQNKIVIAPNEPTSSSSLIIDSRSFNSNTKAELSFDKNKNSKFSTVENPMTVSLTNVSQSVNNTFSFFPSIQSIATINENNSNVDENSSTLLTDKFKSPSSKSEQTESLKSPQDVNSS